jgi:hypothetical protein
MGMGLLMTFRREFVSVSASHYLTPVSIEIESTIARSLGGSGASSAVGCSFSASAQKVSSYLAALVSRAVFLPPDRSGRPNPAGVQLRHLAGGSHFDPPVS